MNTILGQLLITSMLDEKWTDIYLAIGSDIKIYRDGGDLVNMGKLIKSKNQQEKPNIKTLLFTISPNNIIGIVRDCDNLSLRIDCRSSYHNTLGYYLVKFNKNEYYYETTRLIETNNLFKNIEWSNRTFEQDKNK